MNNLLRRNINMSLLNYIRNLIVTIVVTLCGLNAIAQDKSVYPLAIFPFQVRGQTLGLVGTEISDILFAHMIKYPDLYLVEREELSKIFDEQQIGLSGIVDSETAVKVGRLTGAKLLIAGSALDVSGKTYLVAKIISAETSRVLGASVKGEVGTELDKLTEELAEKIVETIREHAKDLVPKRPVREDRLTALKKQMQDRVRPSVFIGIQEQHMGRLVIDPAAETELSIFCKELGFTVIDSKLGSPADADILLLGEGMSEFSARHANLISTKARLEVKAIARETGQVIAIDREVTLGVDLTEQIGAKHALQEAAANIATRLLPKISVAKLNAKK